LKNAGSFAYENVVWGKAKKERPEEKKKSAGKHAKGELQELLGLKRIHDLREQ